jgi:hypothetical protein
MVDPCAHRIATHKRSIIGLQQVGDRGDVLYHWIKPEIVAAGIEDYWHSVVNGRGHCVRHCGQNRTRLDPLPLRAFPAVPQSSKREQLAFVNFKIERLLAGTCALPFVEAIFRDQAPADHL